MYTLLGLQVILVYKVSDPDSDCGFPTAASLIASS